MVTLPINVPKGFLQNLEHNFELLGQRIEYFRIQKGISREELCNSLNITRKEYSRYVTKNNGRFEIYKKICDFLEAPYEFIFDSYYNFLLSDYDVKIANYRLKNNLSYEDFGKLILTEKSTVAKWEKRKHYPSPEKFLLIIQLLEV